MAAPFCPVTMYLVVSGTVKPLVAKVMEEKPPTWDMYLDAVMFGPRTKKQRPTKFSPFLLMFRREAHYPSEVPEHYEVTLKTILYMKWFDYRSRGFCFCFCMNPMKEVMICLSVWFLILCMVRVIKCI